MLHGGSIEKERVGTPNTNNSDTELDRSSHHQRKLVPWNNINTQPNQ
ncbi:hypothetical protein A2U01_0065057, partial [Trifolium medium]|nr:hypothetical protein [Trifolium medium]